MPIVVKHCRRRHELRGKDTKSPFSRIILLGGGKHWRLQKVLKTIITMYGTSKLGLASHTKESDRFHVEWGRE
jgi:hypothetical protein